MHTPSWFSDDQVLIVNAKTCGINKDGKEQYLVNPSTGTRSNSEIDDSLADCCDAIVNRKFDRDEVFYHPLNDMIDKDVFVPKFYDHKTLKGIESLSDLDDNFTLKTLGELVNDDSILVFGGHGSPSSDQRIGTVPYIKVSDLRAGHVNINPTNMVPVDLAKKFWKAENSGLLPYDLISPERASKNIGEFCVLMPGQEQSVFTKEVIIVRASSPELFDQFYLLWALSLDVVRAQWERVVFMQTNREDVGKRMLEIVIPVPKNIEAAEKYSKSFKEYYMSLETSRTKFIDELKKSKFQHHIHLGE